MKKNLTTVLTIFIIFSAMAISQAQSDFEGEIVYQIEYGQLPNQPGIENMLPKQMKNSIKGNKTRIDQTFGTSGNSQIIVTDYTNMVAFIASDMMGQKMLINIGPEDMNASMDQYKNAEVTYLDEYKDILGYKCQKATINTGGTTTSLFFTEELPNRANQQFIKIKGMPMEYSISQQGIEMTISAISVDKKTIDPSLYDKPSGYQEFSLDDVKKMGMGNIKF